MDISNSRSSESVSVLTLGQQNSLAHKQTLEIWRAFVLFASAAYLPGFLFSDSLMSIVLKNIAPARWLIRKTAFKHFCGGENLLECQPAVQELAKLGVFSILDFSAESLQSETEYEKNAQEIRNTIQWAAQDKNISYAVFKPTAIVGLDLLQKKQSLQNLSLEEQEAWQRAEQRFRELCKSAFEHKVRLFVDAEESWIQEPVDRWVEEASATYNRDWVCIFNTLQMYRHDRLTYLQDLHKKAQEQGFLLGFKLVRGAYLDKENERAVLLGVPSPIYASKKETDNAFDEAAKFCITNHNKISVCLGTHNVESVMHALKLMDQLGISATDRNVHFAQLYGMSDPLTYYLGQLKVHVSKYVPYGPIAKVMPYLVRRLQENRGVAGQINREMLWIAQELKRRF